MRYLSSYKIYENVAQARAILRRNKVSDSDINFKKILDTTNRDGYTGILTKWVFEDGIDLDEVLGLYTDIKSSNLNIADINKLSYEDVLEKIYPEKEKNYEFIFQYKNYNFYLVKNYQGILEIGSPSWCLKTKMNYDNYTKNGKNPQFVLVRKDKVINGKIQLLSPVKSTEYGITGYRSVDPKCRYGVTLDKHTKSIFDDNNIYSVDRHSIDEDLIQKLMDWSSENFKSESTLSKFEDYFISMIEDILNDDNIDDRSFSFIFGQYNDRERPISHIKDYINHNPPKYWVDVKKDEYWSTFLSEYSDNRNLIGNSPISNMNGWTDIILYELDRLVSISAKDAHPLYGIMLSECPESESIIKYEYGYQNTLYGLEMIKQSFGTLENWYKYLGSKAIENEIINNDSMYIESIISLRNELYRDESLRHYLGDLNSLKFSEYKDGKVFIYLNKLISAIENMNVMTSASVIKTEVIHTLRNIFNKDFKIDNDIITFSL